MNFGGLGFRMGSPASGSPVILRTMRNFPGNSPMTGLTFNATGLYFLPLIFFEAVAAANAEADDESSEGPAVGPRLLSHASFDGGCVVSERIRLLTFLGVGDIME